MGKEFLRCDGWNFVGSSRGTSWNLGTRAKHCQWDWPLPFFKAWHASQHSVPTLKDLFLSPGRDWFLLVPHMVVPSSWHLNCVPTGRYCLVTRASWLLLRKLLRADRGGTSFQWLLRGVCPFCTGLGMKGDGGLLCFFRTSSISETPCFPFVLGILWSLSKSLLGCRYPTEPSKKYAWTPSPWNVPCSMVRRLAEVFFFSCWLVTSSLSSPPWCVLMCEVLWFFPLAYLFALAVGVTVTQTAAQKDALLFCVPLGW